LGSPYPGAAYVPNPSTPWVIINVSIQASRIADLTQTRQRRIIGTTAQELTGDWRGYALRNPQAVLSPPYWTNVPTQRLGHALHGVPHLEGSLTYSAKVTTRKNLVIFPKKLGPGSMVQFHDPVSGMVVSIP
jgi:hypothetical protein